MAFGQGACSPDKIALKDTGRPAGGASIKVCPAGGVFPGCTSSLFTDPTLSVGAGNPVTADALGNWGFCAAAGANYDYQITCSGCTTLTVKNYPLPPTTPITAAKLVSNSLNPANVGQVELASTDCIDWKSVVSGNIQLCKTGVAAGTVPADTFDMTAAATRSQAFIDNSANPAASGALRSGNNVCAVAARNAANSGDVCAVQVNASNQTVIGGSVADTGTGTTNKLPKFTTGASGIVGDSSISDNGTAVSSSEPFTLTPNKQIFSASGTFTIPTGVTAVKVTLLGGGGAGGGATAANVGTGGGSGGIALKWLSGLTPGNTIVVTVGAGGTGVSAAAGNNGAASTIASGTQTITTVTGNPGLGGASQAAVPAGGGGGAAISTNGDINGAGVPGHVAYSTAAGTPGGSTFLGGAGTVAGGSSAGNAAVANTGSGGGGAGAGANNAGGNGGSGIVIFEWTN